MLYLNKRVEEVKNGKNRELLWILEHPTTYTAGVSFNKKEIIDKKIKIVKSNRGGKITLHNPGQRIVYFVINLNKRKKDIRKLINSVEKSIIQFLKNYKIKAKNDKKNIGIWVNDKKIAAIGIRVSRWVAYHGCSIIISSSDLPEIMGMCDRILILSDGRQTGLLEKCSLTIGDLLTNIYSSDLR